MSSLAGQTFAGYEILSELGRGGMGAVYKARQPRLDRLVALKVMAYDLASDRDFVARFKREANAAASLNHENIVQVFSAGESEGSHFIAMEFVEGTTLRHHIESHGRLDPREAIAIATLVAQALQHAWNKARLIHRDIKPDNIFLSHAGEVKVGDLGLAKTVGGSTTSLTQTGTAMGSPHYISPEQATGAKEIDFRTDIYSLGCTLYHMLTGQTPYQGDSSMVVMMKHVNDPPPAIFKVWPSCPMPLGLLVGKMLAKNRNSRPANYEDLIEQLHDLHDKLKPSTTAASAPVSASDPTQLLTPTPKPAPAPPQPTPKPAVAKATTPRPAPPAKKKGGSRTMLFAAAGVAAVAVIAGAVWWFAGRVPPRDDGSAATAPLVSRLRAESGATQPAKAGTPTSAPTEAAASPKFGMLFDGRDTSAWQQRDGGDCQWQVNDGALVAGKGDLDTREKFQDFKLHIEFAVPRDAKQGNSGVYLQGRYEVQILDSFGKPVDDGCCGSIFKLKAPAENASKPPDEWQTFDIGFRAAQFDAAGAKTANARVSVTHNGRLIHDYVEIPKSTGKGEPESAAPGPIRLQSYGSPARFRNIRISPVDTAAAAAPADAAWQNAINLLPLIDPAKDALGGEWNWRDNKLISDSAKNGRIAIPYQPPQEYDYRLVFHFTEGYTPEGAGQVIQILSKGGRLFSWIMGAKKGEFIAFETIAGANSADRANPTITQRKPALKKDVTYTSIVEVRNDGLKAYLNGELLAQWKTDYSDMGIVPHWSLPDPTLLGVGSWLTGLVIEKLEVREITGKGQLARPAP